MAGDVRGGIWATITQTYTRGGHIIYGKKRKNMLLCSETWGDYVAHTNMPKNIYCEYSPEYTVAHCTLVYTLYTHPVQEFQREDPRLVAASLP